MASFIKELQANKKQVEKGYWGDTSGMHKGYYFCIKIDGIETKYYFGTTFPEAQKNFEKAANQWITPKNGYRWGVEYSDGKLENGYIGWGNVDLSEEFY